MCDVDQQVAESQQQVTPASHEQDEGERPQVLVEGDGSSILLPLTQCSAQQRLEGKGQVLKMVLGAAKVHMTAKSQS